MVNEPKNPEALHNIADNLGTKRSLVNGKWVNPGTPMEPFVKREDMPTATIPKATERLREVLVK